MFIEYLLNGISHSGHFVGDLLHMSLWYHTDTRIVIVTVIDLQNLVDAVIGWVPGLSTVSNILSN